MMARTRDEIEQLILDKIFLLTRKKIGGPEDELVGTGILTSVTLAELAVELERELNIHFSFLDISRENFSTPLRIRTLVEQKLAHAL